MLHIEAQIYTKADDLFTMAICISNEGHYWHSKEAALQAKTYPEARNEAFAQIRALHKAISPHPEPRLTVKAGRTDESTNPTYNPTCEHGFLPDPSGLSGCKRCGQP